MFPNLEVVTNKGTIKIHEYLAGSNMLILFR